jgi:hypothetical protein
MSYHNGPRIVTDGLVLLLDAGNSKSYPGSGTLWTDLSGNSNNGTLTNGPTYNSANKGGVVLDGVNDYIVKDSMSSFSVYHISMWIKPASLVNSSVSIGSLIQLRYQAAGSYAWYISLGSATSLLSNEYITIADLQNGGRMAVADGGSLLANNWYNLVFNYDTEYKIYINGVLKNTVLYIFGAVPLLTNPNKLYIGTVDGDGAGTRGFFNGTIGQTSIYNRSLSSNEIQQNYNALKGRYL